MFESFFLRGQSTSIRSIEREADECFPTKSWPSGILPRPRSLRPASSSALDCMQAVPTEQCLESTLSTLCAPRTLHQGCISLVDCPTQLICTWIFICWVGGGYSIQGVVKCLSPYFTQDWAFLTNFFAKYTCHQNKWELEAKNWFIEVENMPKKRSFLKSFHKRASLKSGIPEMSQLNSGIPELSYLKSRIPEMSQLNSGIPDLSYHNSRIPKMGQLKSGIPELCHHRSGIAANKRKHQFLILSLSINIAK